MGDHLGSHRQFYEGKLKWAKISNSPLKQEFFEKVLAEDWDSEFFKRHCTTFRKQDMGEGRGRGRGEREGCLGVAGTLRSSQAVLTPGGGGGSGGLGGGGVCNGA